MFTINDRYLRILPNFTIQQSIYLSTYSSYQVIWSLGGKLFTKLWIFKNGINVTEVTFYIQFFLCGNMSRNFKMVPFCSL